MIPFLIPMLGSSRIINNFNYEIDSNGFYNNIYDVQDSGFRLRSAFAEVAYTTNHTSLEVTWHSKGYTTAPIYVNIFINEVYYQTLLPISGKQYSTISISLPMGTKIVMLRQGSTWVSPLQGADITNVKFSGGEIATPYIPLRKANRMVTASDSIGVGAGTTNNGLKGWQMLLREQMTDWEFASIGASGASASLVQNSTDAQSIVDYLSGATNKVLWWALGTNDTGVDITTWGNNLATWLDSIHVLDSTIKVYIQTMIYRDGVETQLDLLRQKEREIANTRSSWCTLIEAQTWIPIEQYYPDTLKVHPNDTGNITYANKVKDVLLATNAISTKLFAAYKLASGVDSKGGYNGTVGSSITFSSGVDGNGANFNNTTNSYISIPNNTVFNFSTGSVDKAFSIKANVKFNNATDQIIVAKRNSAAGTDEFQLSYVSGELIGAIFSLDTTSILQAKILFTFTVGTFYCITMSYDGSGSKNGINLTINTITPSTTKVTSGTYIRMPVGIAPVFVGRAGWADGLRLNGQIDELYFFNGVLNYLEIKALQSTFYPF